MRLRLLALVALGLLAACKSDEEKLVDLRSELRWQLDALYTEYGGGKVANDARAEAEKAGAGDEGPSLAARLIGEVDRSYFEGHCFAIGRGERPFSLSGRLEAFMKEPDHEKACREAVRTKARIAELEERVAPR